MGKYEPLTQLLRTTTSATVTLSFNEIQKFVGALPHSAYVHRAWWANDDKTQAQAWKAAGWKVASVSLESERVTFARHDNTQADLSAATDRHRPTAPPATAGEIARPKSSAPLDEAAVQAQVVTFLVAEGWSILRVADTATREHGVDVLARRDRDDRTVAIEVKGFPGSRYADPRRAAEAKSTSPATQARQYFSHALLKALMTADDHPNYESVIALPDVETYRRLHQRVRRSLSRAGVSVLFIDLGGRVDWIIEPG